MLIQMNFRNRKKIKILQTENYEENRLSFYKNVPVEEITLEEFERYAVERLKMLREVENINIRFKRNSEDYIKNMKKVLYDFLPFDKREIRQPATSKETKIENFEVRDDKALTKKMEEWNCEKQESRRKDVMSHFILRLAFARSEDLRRWLLTQEIDLFRFRFQQESIHMQHQFLTQNQLEFECVDKEELVKEERNLINTTLSYRKTEKKEDHATSDEVYYKVPFTDVLELVKNRKVFLKKGLAYVPSDELISIIIGSYRTHLSQSLAITARKLPYLEEDTRLLPMLKNLSSAYIGDSYNTKNNTNEEKLSLSEIDQSSKLSFPICMRSLHDGLRQDHHLKHFGRLQYGLFLKAAGLSLEEALIFWRTEFTKKMDVDKFEKQYAYNVRHSYGKEGKRADYTPYSCLRIITTNQPGPGDFHGCPFKHSDKETLMRRLQSYKVPTENITEIIDLVNRQHYQVACVRYFEVKHKISEGSVSINHPNDYFHQSRRLLKASTEKNSSEILKTEPKEVKKEPAPTASLVHDNITNMNDYMEMI